MNETDPIKQCFPLSKVSSGLSHCKKDRAELKEVPPKGSQHCHRAGVPSSHPRAAAEVQRAAVQRTQGSSTSEFSASAFGQLPEGAEIYTIAHDPRAGPGRASKRDEELGPAAEEHF